MSNVTELRPDLPEAGEVLKASRTTMKVIADRIAEALKAHRLAETCVIVNTLALDGQGSDFDNRIAESLKDRAWDSLSDAYRALHEAMALIPEPDRPADFELDEGAAELAIELLGAKQGDAS